MMGSLSNLEFTESNETHLQGMCCTDTNCYCDQEKPRSVVLLAKNEVGLLDLRQLWWRFVLSNTDNDEKKGEPPCEFKVDRFKFEFASYLIDRCGSDGAILDNIIFAYIDPSDRKVATIAQNPAGGEYIKFLNHDSDKRYFNRVSYLNGAIVSKRIEASLNESDDVCSTID